jgi:lipid-A-disaccharide synthase
MLEVAAAFPAYQPVIAGAPGIERSCYFQYTSRYPVKIVFNKTYPLLYHCSAALVTSGTATLEASLFRVPQVVCYYVKIGKIAGFIFRHFFRADYISLVNLIAGREVVQELFADRFSYPAIYTELKRILYDASYQKQMLDGYDEVIHILGKPGASRRTAWLICKYLHN